MNLNDTPLARELMRTEGRAEIVSGAIRQFDFYTHKVSRARGAILVSLHQFLEDKRPCAASSSLAFLVDLPHRGSFSPPVSVFDLPPAGMKFPVGAPMFAVEIETGEEDLAAKRADYFAAGTLVVWGVDLLSEEIVRSYTAQNPKAPQVFKRGQVANAQPAVAGWTMEVDRLFRPEWEEKAE